MEVVLTPHGRRLLSQGNLKPSYYAFFDDDVVYDNRYCNANPDSVPTVELQNATEDRIQEDTPRIKPIKTRRSIDEELKHFAGLKQQEVQVGAEFGSYSDIRTYTIMADIMPNELGEIQRIALQPQEDKLYALKNALGTADPYSSNYPAWDIEFMQAEITDGFTTYLQETGVFVHPVTLAEETRTIRFENIPQLEVEGKYKTHILDYAPEDINEDEVPESRVIIEEDFILMKVEEKNSEFLLKNFDIELFRVEDKFVDGRKEGERLIPLIFAEETQKNIPFELAVENYFDVHFDDKIPNHIICNYINDQSQGVFSDMLVDCGDAIGEETSLDIYTGLSDDPGEDC